MYNGAKIKVSGGKFDRVSKEWAELGEELCLVDNETNEKQPYAETSCTNVHVEACKKHDYEQDVQYCVWCHKKNPDFQGYVRITVNGVETYVEMLGTNDAPGDWYPMWSYSNNFTTNTDGGVAWTKIGELKHEKLPQVVMAKDFDGAWSEYMKAYSDCKPEDFISELQTELDRRMEQAAQFK